MCIYTYTYLNKVNNEQCRRFAEAQMSIKAPRVVRREVVRLCHYPVVHGVQKVERAALISLARGATTKVKMLPQKMNDHLDGASSAIAMSKWQK